MYEQEKFEIAAAALEKLEKMHNRFLAHVASLNAHINGGTFTATGGQFNVVVLGVPLTVARRPIVVEGSFAGLEYNFLAKHDDKDLRVWRFYLDSRGNLFKDAAFANRLCDYNNPDLLTYVMPPIASALMTSPIFTVD